MKHDIEKLKKIKNEYLSYLNIALKSNDNLIRVDALELTADLLDSLIKKMADSLKDKDELVQISIIEAINQALLSIIDLKPKIRELLYSSRWLVRAYAAEILGDLKDTSSKNILKGMLENATVEEKIRIYYALYKMEEETYLGKLFNCLDHEYYRVRMASAALLEKLINTHNKDKIFKQLKSRLLKEEEPIVANRLKDIIESYADKK